MKSVRNWIVILLVSVTLIGCAYGRHLKQGDALFEQGQYAEALTHYEAARAIDPESTEVASRIEATREKLVARDAAVAREALAAGDYLRAITATHAAHVRMPESATVAELIEEVTRAVNDKAGQLQAQQDFANALLLYEQVSDKLPPSEGLFRRRASRVRAQWLEALVARARTAEEAGRKGDAVLSWAKATQLSGDSEHSAKRDALRDELLAQVQYVVQLRVSGGDEAISSVRASLASAYGGTALRLAAANEKVEKSAARVNAKIGRPRFETRRDTRPELARYQSGTRQVENPFYKSKQDDLLREERRLVDYENELSKAQSDVERYRAQVDAEGPSPNTSTGAEQSLYNAQNRVESARRRVEDQRRQVQRAREELARESQFKEEPVYSDHQYTVTTHTRVASSRVRVKVRHGDGRPPVEVDERVEVSASDEQHAAQPVAGVAEDPLQLPSNAELRTELYAKASQAVTAGVASSFEGWRSHLLERARNSAGDDERIDLYVLYILTNPREVEASVAREISALRGIPDPVRVLSF